MQKTSNMPGLITSLRFINRNKHFLACTTDGFFVCETDSAEPKIKATIPGGVALCDSYKNSNIFFVVGTGSHVDFPSTKLCLWNASTNSVAGEVQFNPSMQIVDLHVKGDWVLVIFKDRFKLFNFEKGFTQSEVVAEFQTQPNTSKSGKVAIFQVSDESSMCIAFADSEKKGKVQLLHFSPENYQLIKDKACYVTNGQEFGGLSFSQDGFLLHVSVENGTQLDTYNVFKRELVKQVGRGKTPAVVNCISSDGIYLACCSDRKTTHLFNIADGTAQS